MQIQATLIIPARNEEATIGGVVEEVRRFFVGEIVVVDNGSSDATSEVARAAGARAVLEPTPGYGRACMAGVGAATDADVLVFMDGDGSDMPAYLPALIERIEAGADLVLGVRRGTAVEAASMTGAARFGNWLASWLLAVRYRRRVHDLSPMKAVRRPHFEAVRHDELTYGWTVELIARSLASKARIDEVVVGYRRRAAGVSKVSGDLRASVRAGVRILLTIARVSWRR